MRTPAIAVLEKTSTHRYIGGTQSACVLILQSQASKEALFEQLRSVFIARGYDGATLVNLARAAHLSKASLYHHFPGGKPEMVDTLVRHAIADLQQQAFSHLAKTGTPNKKLRNFIDGFSAYTQHGGSDCLLAVLSHHSTATAETQNQQRVIAEQFADWLTQLTGVFEEYGLKSKKAEQEAQGLVAHLYGALLTAKMQNDANFFRAAIKRMKKRLKQQEAVRNKLG